VSKGSRTRSTRTRESRWLPLLGVTASTAEIALENGEFMDPVPLAAGALLRRADIRLLELYEVKDDAEAVADQQTG
jgi:hypothetical protein